MDFQPNTSLHLNLPNNQLNLELVLEPSSSSPSSPHSPAEPRSCSCNYCQRKFYSSQALGGHENAHKPERTLAKKSRELSSAVRAHGRTNSRSGSSSMSGFNLAVGPEGLIGRTASFRILHIHPSHYGRTCPIDTFEGRGAGFEHRHGHGGRFVDEVGYGRREINYGGSSDDSWSTGYRTENEQEELNQLDLSLRL